MVEFLFVNIHIYNIYIYYIGTYYTYRNKNESRWGTSALRTYNINVFIDIQYVSSDRYMNVDVNLNHFKNIFWIFKLTYHPVSIYILYYINIPNIPKCYS